MNDPIEQECLREAFRESISIVRLEGWEPKADFYALQERVIVGELTIGEAVKIVVFTSSRLIPCCRETPAREAV